MWLGEIDEVDMSEESGTRGVGEWISMDRCLYWEDFQVVYPKRISELGWKLSQHFINKVKEKVMDATSCTHCNALKERNNMDITT